MIGEWAWENVTPNEVRELRREFAVEEVLHDENEEDRRKKKQKQKRNEEIEEYIGRIKLRRLDWDEIHGIELFSISDTEYQGGLVSYK